MSNNAATALTSPLSSLRRLAGTAGLPCCRSSVFSRPGMAAEIPQSSAVHMPMRECGKKPEMKGPAPPLGHFLWTMSLDMAAHIPGYGRPYPGIWRGYGHIPEYGGPSPGIWPYPGYAYPGYGRHILGYGHPYPGIWPYPGYVYPGYTTFFRRPARCTQGSQDQICYRHSSLLHPRPTLYQPSRIRTDKTVT